MVSVKLGAPILLDSPYVQVILAALPMPIAVLIDMKMDLAKNRRGTAISRSENFR